jgi:diguanylate cyclase (GGDEF)-like protein
MKLDNLTPEQQAQWRALLRENQTLREKITALESTRNAASPVLTRPEFIREIARMVAHDERYGGTSSLVVLNVEQLLEQKHKIGTQLYDAILQNLTDCIVANVRSCDVIGRTGSDDFAIMLTRCKLEDAEKKAELLVNTIKQKLDPLLDDKIALGMSYMVSILNSRDDAKKSLSELTR